MPALDPSQSAFAHVRELIVESPMASDTNWRTHAVDRITGMSKAAVVAIGLTVAMGGALAHGPQQSAPSTAAAEAVAQQEFQAAANRAADAKYARMEQLADLYVETLREGQVQKVWSQLRPDVKIFTQYGENDLGGQKTVAERVGLADQDLKGPKSREQLNEIDSIIAAIGRSEQNPAAAISLASAYFKPAAKPEGSVCTLSFNPHVDQIHDEIKRMTKWPDDVIRDHVIRHEATHCIEQSDRNAYLVQKLNNSAAVAGTLIAEKTKILFDDTLGKMSRAPNTDHPDDQSRANLMSAMLKTMNPSSSNNAEEIADALPLLSLIKEGRLEVKALGEMAFMRTKSKFAGDVHDTSSLLYNLEKELSNKPEIVAKWRGDHAKDVASGAGLQVKELLDWVSPRWKAHADARDSAKYRTKELSSIPGFSADADQPQVKSTDKTVNHFLSMFKRDEPAATSKPKP